MGSFIAFVATAIMFYCSMVSGWCLYYFFQSLAADLSATLPQAEHVWYGFQGAAMGLFLLYNRRIADKTEANF